MFTGIISDVGQVIDIKPSGELRRLRIASAYDAKSIQIGASIANSGPCLTVVGVEPLKRGSAIAFDVGAETLGARGAMSTSSARLRSATSSAAIW
jgi:riboflavin synthase